MRKQAARTSEVISASEFHLVDKDGRLRLRMSTWPTDGNPILEFYDSDGHGRLSLSLGEGSRPAVSLMRSDGSTAIGLGVLQSGDGGLSIYQSDGTCILAIGVELASTVVMDTHNKKKNET